MQVEMLLFDGQRPRLYTRYRSLIISSLISRPMAYRATSTCFCPGDYRNGDWAAISQRVEQAKCDGFGDADGKSHDRRWGCTHGRCGMCGMGWMRGLGVWDQH